MRHHHTSAAMLVSGLLLSAALTACGSSGASSPGRSATIDPSGTVAPHDVPAAASAGCSVTPAVPAGETKVDLSSGGDARFYLRHVPSAHDGITPVPVVMDLHGWSETAALQELASGFGPYGDTKGFVTVTPEAQGSAHVWDLSLGGKDLTYLGGVLDDVERTLCVDQNRIFVAGYSYGAYMTSAMACQFADRVAAAGPVAGIFDPQGCNPSRPVPVIAIHGTADRFVPYDGSVGTAALGLPAPDGSGKTLGQSGLDTTKKGPTILDNTTAWALRNGCDANPAETPVAADVTKISFSCPPGAEVVLYRVTEGGHAWPGSDFTKSIASVVGPTTFSINATELMWQFFEDHPKSS
jgi:polyhydroxybutyrate depolymerase